MFAPLNATMLNTGPASLGLSVFAVGNAVSDAWAFRFTDMQRAAAVGIATTDESFQRRIAGYWGTLRGNALTSGLQNKYAAGRGSLVSIAISEMTARNATRWFEGSTTAVGNSYGGTLRRTAIGFGEWLAEAKADMEIRNATRRFKGSASSFSVIKAKAVRWVIPTTEVYANADTFAWRLLASYRAADIRRTLVLNTERVSLPLNRIIELNYEDRSIIC